VNDVLPERWGTKKSVNDVLPERWGTKKSANDVLPERWGTKCRKLVMALNLIFTSFSSQDNLIRIKK
jgi:hypothetical protein